MTDLKHPALSLLKRTLTATAHCAGVIPVPSEAMRLAFQTTSTANREASMINLSSASTQDLDSLVRACRISASGRGKDDVLDSDLCRKAGELDPNRFISSFDPIRLGIIDAVSVHLLDAHEDCDGEKTLVPQLSKLSAYGPACFSKPYQDTPDSEPIYVSLVIIFPTPHTGGALVIRHRSEEFKIDPAGLLIDSSSIAYIAFHSNVEHEVQEITSGHRITLTYHLYLERPSTPRIKVKKSLDAGFRALEAAFLEVLDDPSFLPDGGRLGFAFRHRYPALGSSIHRADQILEYLKGPDATLVAVCNKLALTALPRFVYTVDATYRGIISEVMLDLIDQGQLLYPIIGEILGMYGDAVESFDENTPTHAEIEWVTGENSIEANSVSADYIAYGKDHEKKTIYGDICLIVEIGEFGKRDVPVNEVRRTTEE